jgi:hypothetical protein
MFGAAVEPVRFRGCTWNCHNEQNPYTAAVSLFHPVARLLPPAANQTADALAQLLRSATNQRDRLMLLILLKRSGCLRDGFVGALNYR